MTKVGIVAMVVRHTVDFVDVSGRGGVLCRGGRTQTLLLWVHLLQEHLCWAVDRLREHLAPGAGFIQPHPHPTPQASHTESHQEQPRHQIRYLPSFLEISSSLASAISADHLGFPCRLSVLSHPLIGDTSGGH